MTIQKSYKMNRWYKTTDGYDVEFVKPIEVDGMYNVFRHTESNDYAPYYTDENGLTGYGERILRPLSSLKMNDNLH